MNGQVDFLGARAFLIRFHDWLLTNHTGNLTRALFAFELEEAFNELKEWAYNLRSAVAKITFSDFLFISELSVCQTWVIANFTALKVDVRPVIESDPEVNWVRVQGGEQVEDGFGLWGGKSLRKQLMLERGLFGCILGEGRLNCVLGQLDNGYICLHSKNKLTFHFQLSWRKLHLQWSNQQWQTPFWFLPRLKTSQISGVMSITWSRGSLPLSSPPHILAGLKYFFYQNQSDLFNCHLCFQREFGRRICLFLRMILSPSFPAGIWQA